MRDVTRILDAIAAGDSPAAAQLLPLVYEELRTLAAHRLANEKPGQTLQATALVHEAFLRLVGDQRFDGRRHFFAAAAEAMRRILIDRARSKGSVRHGGARKHISIDEIRLATETPSDDLLDVDEAIGRLAELDPTRAELVKLRFFAGLTMPEAAATMGLSVATAERYWAFARSWLHAQLTGEED
jgi:RNA polymerase sigma factor (TIGR02999 family)